MAVIQRARNSDMGLNKIIIMVIIAVNNTAALTQLDMGCFSGFADECGFSKRHRYVIKSGSHAGRRELCPRT